jgi:long-chain acyl-CoA synthetase
MQKMAKSGCVKRGIFGFAFLLKKLYLMTKKNGIKNPHLPLIDLIFSPISQAMGGNVEFIVSGSSALTKEVRDFLEVCTGARITIGYGLSECSSAGAYNYCGQKMNHANQLGFMSY